MLLIFANCFTTLSVRISWFSEMHINTTQNWHFAEEGKWYRSSWLTINNINVRSRQNVTLHRGGQLKEARGGLYDFATDFLFRCRSMWLERTLKLLIVNHGEQYNFPLLPPPPPSTAEQELDVCIGYLHSTPAKLAHQPFCSTRFAQGAFFWQRVWQ